VRRSDVAEVKVKICGLTRPQDVDAAVAAGADAVGFVFTRSPREVAPNAAARLAARVPDGVLRVGLFLDPERADVTTVLETVPLDLLQFHGAEAPAFCAAFALPYLKAVSMLDAGVDEVVAAHDAAAGLLLDSHDPGGAGGTGRAFDWRRRVTTDRPLWLAGGLVPDNVAEAVRTVRPYAVDVSSGVESAPGIKDPERILSFTRNAKQANHEPANTDPS